MQEAARHRVEPAVAAHPDPISSSLPSLVQDNNNNSSSLIINTILNKSSETNIGNKESILVIENNHVLVDDSMKYHLNDGNIDPERVDKIRELAAKHLGHENQHLAMVLILITVTIMSQVLLVLWKAKHQKSYIHASMIIMYIVPFGIAAYRHWWRFVTIWVVISLITTFLVWRPLVMPNFSQSTTVPRKLYKWFFIIYSVSSLIAVTGYMILLLTFFGMNLLLGVSPQTALDVGLMLLFYGIYYGVLCRDFTDFLVDKLAASIGYYNPSSALPSKSLRSNVCAICGLEHGDKEDIDMDGLTKSDALLASMGDYTDTDLHPDHETLISYNDENHPERLFVLTCGHKFHEYCIYGWCLIGKRQVCPFCREKVDLGRMFSALPFQRPHYLYGNLLDFIRYLFAWQPIIFLIVHLLDYELGLE